MCAVNGNTAAAAATSERAQYAILYSLEYHKSSRAFGDAAPAACECQSKQYKWLERQPWQL